MSDESSNKWEEIASKSIEMEEGALNDDKPVAEDHELLQGEQHEPASDEDKRLLTLESKILNLEKEASQEKEKALRAVAELENVRRRATRDVENAHKYGIEKLLQELLPVVDSLEQALEAEQNLEEQSVSAIKEGTELTLSLFLKALEKFSLVQLNPVGEAFNPLHHEAISMQPNSELAANTVLHVVQKGYLLNERVVRPARVIVSKAAS